MARTPGRRRTPHHLAHPDDGPPVVAHLPRLRHRGPRVGWCVCQGCHVPPLSHAPWASAACGCTAHPPTHVLTRPGVVKMYETRLKELNPHLTDITYDVSHLFAFIDSLGDLSALAYVPCGGGLPRSAAAERPDVTPPSSASNHQVQLSSTHVRAAGQGGNQEGGVHASEAAGRIAVRHSGSGC